MLSPNIAVLASDCCSHSDFFIFKCLFAWGNMSGTATIGVRPFCDGEGEGAFSGFVLYNPLCRNRLDSFRGVAEVFSPSPAHH